MMTIQLPDDLGNSIEAAVRDGRFASANALIEQAVRSLLDPPTPPESEDLVLGLFRDDAALIDEIVAEAYQRRQSDTWREIEF